MNGFNLLYNGNMFALTYDKTILITVDTVIEDNTMIITSIDTTPNTPLSIYVKLAEKLLDNGQITSVKFRINRCNDVILSDLQYCFKRAGFTILH